MAEKCTCETDVCACCACVSMHCDECHKPTRSKFVQGRYCSNCGRPLKAELARNYVPKSEFEQLQHKYELSEAEREANVKGFADEITKANSECEKWYHDYHVIKEELKQEKAYHKETEKLADRYLLALHTAKSTIARKIFEEIKRVSKTVCVPKILVNGIVKSNTLNGVYLDEECIADLEKKYTEERE